ATGRCLPHRDPAPLCGAGEALTVERERHVGQLSLHESSRRRPADDLLARDRVPRLQRPVEAEREQALAVGGERQAVDRLAGPFKPGQFPALASVPDADKAARASGSDARPVRAEADAPPPVAWSPGQGQDEQLTAIEGKSGEETAKLLGVSVDAV